MTLSQSATSRLTLEEARERCVPGWNIACQRCGSFGALWVGHILPKRNQQRLCETCRDEHIRVIQGVWDFFKVRYTQEGEPRERMLNG